MIRIIESNRKDKLIADWSRVPRYLYHATSYDYIDDIEKYGLGFNSFSKSSDGNLFNSKHGVFLAIYPDDALEYIQSISQENKLLLRIPKKILDKNKLYYDINNHTVVDYLDNNKLPQSVDLTYFYADIISNPRDKLTILDI